MENLVKPFTIKDVLDRIVKLNAENKSIHCVFDLDSTLFNVSPRSEKILHEFSDLKDQVLLKEVRVHRRDWGLKESMIRHGHKPEDNPELHQDLLSFWRQRFFSNEYLHYDVPYLGAVRFVQYLWKVGVPISYLTGRDVARMSRGTKEVLLKWGFPVEDYYLNLKPRKEMDDELYKLDWFKEQVAQNPQTEFFFFENEPVNVNAIGKISDKIHVIYMDTTHSRKSTVQVPHYAIENFYIEGL